MLIPEKPSYNFVFDYLMNLNGVTYLLMSLVCRDRSPWPRFSVESPEPKHNIINASKKNENSNHFSHTDSLTKTNLIDGIVFSR